MPAAWKRFTRAIAKDGIPIAAAAELESDRINHFQTFLDLGEDIQKLVNLVTTRRATKERTMTGVCAWKKKSWIAKELYNGNTEKADKVCAGLAEQGLKKCDKYLPEDEDETLYWVEIETKLKSAHTASESVSGSCSVQLNDVQASEIFSQGGLLGPNMNPAITGMAERTATSVIVGMDKDDGVQVKKANTKKIQAAPAEPTTAEAAAEAAQSAAMDEIGKKIQKALDQASKARACSMRLKSHEISDQMVEQFDKHKALMDQVYRVMTTMKQQGIKDPAAYSKITDKVEKRFEWFETRSKVANSMCRQLEGDRTAKNK